MSPALGYSINDFNPRSPWGERLTIKHFKCIMVGFQSTLPVGGATNVGKLVPILADISIHAPRGGSDKDKSGADTLYYLFQSTLPVGGAT